MKTETELAAIVVAWLKEFKWDVYQEVQWQQYGGTIDIVATRGPLLRVIECKMSLTATVIDQAWKNRPYAHLVHVAVPMRGWGKGRNVLNQALIRLGIGLLEVSHHERVDWRTREDYTVWNVHETMKSRFDRKAATNCIKDKLREAHKTFAPAGNSQGLRFTPWKDTCQKWAQFVAEHPGCTLKEIITAGHHYASDSSAKISMAKWIESGHVKNITIRREGKLIKLYPIVSAT